MAVLGQKCCICAKLMFSGKGGFIRLGWLYTGKRGCNRASGLFRAKMVALG